MKRVDYLKAQEKELHSQIYDARRKRITGKEIASTSTVEIQHSGLKIIDPHLFNALGQVAYIGCGRSKIAIGLAEGWQLRADICHLEGGNVLTGIRPDGKPYALVGWDSVTESRFRLALDGLALENHKTPSPEQIRDYIQKHLPDDRMRDLIAADLGLEEHQVHFIEQPADFHLDLSMGILNNKHIILDAPNEAANILIKEAEDTKSRLKGLIAAQFKPLITKAKQLVTTYLEGEFLTKHLGGQFDTFLENVDQLAAKGEIELIIGFLEQPQAKKDFTDLKEALSKLPNVAQMLEILDNAIAQTRSNAAHKAYYIDKIAAKLAQALPKDVEVARGPLTFDGPLTQGKAKIVPPMNFANFETGTGKNGRQFLILNGGTEKMQEKMRTWFKQTAGFQGDIDDIFFVDQWASEASLLQMGAMGCRAKACGKVLGRV